MADATQLLRLLEPVVRPDGQMGHARSPVKPIEARGFDSLLDEAAKNRARQETSGATQAPETSAVAPAHLGSLAQVDQIQNTSLRQLIAGLQPVAAVRHGSDAAANRLDGES